MQAQRRNNTLKKIVSMILIVALIVTVLPLPFASVAQAATDAKYFIFQNEKTDPENPRITNSQSVTLQGTLNGVNGQDISYSVAQVAIDKGVITQIASRDEQTAGIVIRGSSITINNLQLYPGLNRIIMQGYQGTSQVREAFFIEYRDGPTMYDLSVSLEGMQQELKETETTVVYSTASKGKPSVNVSLEGKAPNADKVQITVNGRSWTFTVSSNNSWRFFASPITINQGKNLVTIKAFNGTQSVETTREIAFYNQAVTFYDVYMNDASGNKVDLGGYPNITYDDKARNTDIYGRVIIPIVPKSTPDAPDIEYKIGNANKVSIKATDVDASGNKLINIDKVEENYMIMSFRILNPTIETDKRVSIQLSSTNLATTPVEVQSTSGFGVTLKDGSKAYILDGKYLTGYSESMKGDSEGILSLTGVDLNGAQIYSMPTAIEFYLVNGAAENVSLTEIKDAFGKVITGAYKIGDELARTTVVRNVNGVPTDTTRVVYELAKLPTTGKMDITFVAGGQKYPVSVTLLYGPFVKYDKAYDGITIKRDTTQDISIIEKSVMDELGNLTGQLFNIADGDKIVYSSEATASKKQTVNFYVNNTEIKLAPEDAKKNRFRFVLDPNAIYTETLADGRIITYGEVTKAYKALYNGDNKIKIVYRGEKEYYEKVITVTLIPTNRPEIPAEGEQSVFPYSSTHDSTPNPNDPAFQKKGSIYYTSETKMNVYGTFDFLDLGKNSDEAKDKIEEMQNPTDKTAAKYILRVQSPLFKDKLEWSLMNDITIIDKNSSIIVTGVDGAVPGLTVFYNTTTEIFSFLMKEINVPIDGSAAVINFTVYNDGLGGPSASERLEVVPVNVPFTILKPSPEKRVLNQNFIEVVIHSPGADKVLINKVAGTKFVYNETDNDADKVNAYKSLITNLKANKDTKIEIEIIRADKSYKSEFTVRYVPTSIPGAQYMETMKNSHKVFEGKLNLQFEKGTNLIRRDYNAPDMYKTQVYNGNSMLFAIANPTDGVVDRREFEYVPEDYDKLMALAADIFTYSFSNRFIKSGPVFWIDPGLADDINTPDKYDPISNGHDPYQLPSSPVSMFYDRDLSRELIPSKVASLTMSYDENMTNDAGRLISVFRFNPEIQQWENIGGVVDEKKRTITVPFDRFGYYTVGKLAYSYDDVVQHPYARDFIETIFAKGVMNAFELESYFGTDMYLSRAEFTRMIVRGLEIPLNYQGKRHFDDANLPDDQMDQISTFALWDFRYIETAAREGIVRGISPKQFGVNLDISRQDAAVMLAKAMNLKMDTDRTKIRKDLLKYFKDVDDIDYYAQPAVLAIAKKGLISGVPLDPNDPKQGALFQPIAKMLRGDAALIMARVMISTKKLPKM